MSRPSFPSKLKLGALLSLCAGSAAVVASQEPPRETEYPTSFPLLSWERSEKDFLALFRRDGVVRLLFQSSELLPDQLDKSFAVVDRLVAQHNVVRWPQAFEGAHNLSVNPKNHHSLPSPLRKHFHKFSTLAPADDCVQGPHQEGAHATRGNRRLLAFLCEEPAAERGDTALFDMQRAWQLLPADLQRLLVNASFGFHMLNKDGESFLEVPAVVLHEVTGAPCLQFYCFGRARHACVDIYRERSGRYHVRPDLYQYGVDLEKDVMLISSDGSKRPFLALDLYRMLSTIYDTMISHTWSRGDTLVIDNVRWSHARLEGRGLERKIHFLNYGPHDRSFDLRRFARPSLQDVSA